VDRIKLLVIGGTGFIGHHLINAASSLGWEVSSISINKPESYRKNNNVNYIIEDLLNDKSSLNPISDNYKYIINLSGYIDHTNFFSGGECLISNHFDIVRKVVNLVNRDHLKCFINIGSSDEYGSSPAPQNETQREQPISPYSFAKTASTHFLEMLNRSESFPSCSMRLFLVYGPGQKNNRFIPQIIRGCLEDKNFPVSHGEQLRDFCYIDDIVNALLKALTTEKVLGKTYNLASGNPISIRDIISMIQSLIKKGNPIFGKVPYRKSENMQLYANIDKIKNDLDWEPYTPLELGLINTIDWYRENEQTCS